MTVEPFLFSSDPRLLEELGRHPKAVGAVVVDWERRGKEERQAAAMARIGTDTQIGADSPEDLARVVATVDVPVICRINAVGPHTAEEVRQASDLGAHEVLVPMVRRVEEVEEVLRLAGGRVGVGVMVETTDAVRMAASIGKLPIERAYLGLMDLALDRNSPTIFAAVADGTVAAVRAEFDVPFGFGGLTVPGGGDPLPTLALIAEMDRLGCDFTFLRRSFIADIARAGGLHAGLRAIDEAVARASQRPAEVVEADHRELMEAIRGLHLMRSPAT